MAFHLNHLFQTAPQQFLERTVLFMDGINADQVRNKSTYFIDFEPSGNQARARVLDGLHQYQQDASLPSYFVHSAGLTSVSRNAPANRFIFISDFSGCRLLISRDGEENFRLHLEENLIGRVPPPDPAIYIDSFAYWDHITGGLLGVVRGTTVLYKPLAEPWTIIMQLVVGIPGHELVHKTFARPLKL